MDSVQSSSDSDLAYKGDHRLYYSNNAQNQTTMVHLIYENKVFTSAVTIIKTWWLFVIIIMIVLITYTISLLGGYISLKRICVLDALQE